MINSIASCLRSMVAFISLNNLKKYLTKAEAVLAEDNKLKPIIKREILENKSLDKESLKATSKKLKEIIKNYDPANRIPFRTIILEPLQNFFEENRHFDPTEMFNTIRDQKEILVKKEKELSESKKKIEEVSTIPFPKVLANK